MMQTRVRGSGLYTNFSGLAAKVSHFAWWAPPGPLMVLLGGDTNGRRTTQRGNEMSEDPNLQAATGEAEAEAEGEYSEAEEEV
jgi:hypothetical protein